MRAFLSCFSLEKEPPFPRQPKRESELKITRGAINSELYYTEVLYSEKKLIV